MALVRDVVEDVRAPEARVRVEAPSDLWLLADRLRLRQALENLAANAYGRRRAALLSC